MRYALIIFVIFCANQSFRLLPVYNIPGVFNVSDVGLCVMGLTLIWYIVIKQHSLAPLNNVFTWMFGLYLVLVLMQAAFASINFGQSLLDGLVIARHQFYYLSYPFFLVLLDTREKVYIFMRWLSIFCAVLILLGVVNYFGLTVYHHEHAEGHGVRAGIVRAFFPGVSLILFAGFWQLVRYAKGVQPSLWMLGYFLMAYGAVLLRQTRGRILALTIVVIALLVGQRRYKMLGALVLGFAVLAISLSLVYEQNILTNPFLQAYEDVSKSEGTWAAREEQIRLNWDIIWENMYVGNGGLVVRESAITWKSTSGTWFAGYGADLGYMSFLKFFGIPGVLWMILLFAIFAVHLRRALVATDADWVMVRFCGYTGLYMLIAEVTLDFFTIPVGILPMCLTVAMLRISTIPMKQELRGH